MYKPNTGGPTRLTVALLLAFAFAHGVNGLRQVLNDYIRQDKTRTRVSWLLFVLWLVLSLIGAAAIVGGVRMP